MTVADILQMIKRRWIFGVIVLLASLGVTGGLVHSAVPVYSASMTAIGNAASAGDSVGNGSKLGVVARVATAPSVLQPVIDKLGLNMTVQKLASSLTASSDENGFITITAQSTNPKMAADIANSVYASLVQQIQNDSYASSKNDRLSNVELSIVSQAETPSTPVSPNVKKMWFEGILAGVVLGLMVIVVVDLADRRISQAEDVQRIMHTPIISNIPKTDVFKGTSPVVIANPAGIAAGTIRRLAMNLDFITPDKTSMSNITVVTSDDMNEGKTTVAVNLASAIAEKGRRVLLVDTDLRRPSVDASLGINGKIGLAHVLAGKTSLETAIQKYWKPNFHVLPAGEQQANPSILINSQAMHTFLAKAAEHYDSVIVDCAPMNVTTDAAMFTKAGGTMLLVVAQNVSTKKGLKEVATELELVGAEPSGVVFNMVKSAHRGKKGGYYYYEDDDKQQPARRASSSHGTKRDKE